MVRVKPVLYLLAFAAMLLALFMALPLAVSLLIDDGAANAYLRAIAITGLAAIALWLLVHKHNQELQTRDGFLLVSLVWTVLPVFAMLPLLLHIPGLSVTDAYFEAVSGLTASGATVLTGLDALPASINLWRGLMVWVGGMGIIVLAVAILPLLGVGGSQVFKAETPGPMKDTKFTPRIAETARGLWGVYFLFSGACLLAYRWAGMGWADAFMHMCTTMGLGGFSSYDASFGHFNSPMIEWVAIVFMTLAGISFVRYFVVLRSRSILPISSDREIRTYLAVLLAATLLVMGLLLAHGVYKDGMEALRISAFHVVSLATTTGYAATDYTQWPVFAPILLMFLGCFSTCAGSTGGGIKMVRMILLVKQARRELVRIIHPRVINPVTLGGAVIPMSVMTAVLGFMLIYGGASMCLSMLLMLSDLDTVTAFSAVIATVNNIGPGLGEVGPSGNYGGLNPFQLAVLSFAMLLGRLELLSVLVLFSAHFWRK